MGEVRPKKHFGQHFLTNLAVAEGTANAACAHQVPRILEIGPGTGVLTQFFLRKPDIDFKAIEIDYESVDFLRSKYNDAFLINDDFLKLNIATVFDHQPFVLVGNFPYNISTQIVFKMLENMPIIQAMVGMFQAEVAYRIAATHGNKEFGILSVLTQIYYDIDVLYKLPPSDFSPPPKVNSAVINCSLKPQPLLPVNAYPNLAKMVKLVFNHRRKTLRNTLKQGFPNYAAVDDFTLGQRPEQLSIDAFVKLYHQLHPA